MKLYKENIETESDLTHPWNEFCSPFYEFNYFFWQSRIEAWPFYSTDLVVELLWGGE